MSAEPRDLETPAVATRPILIAVGAFLLFAAASGAGLLAYYRAGEGGRPRAAPRPFPEPRLQSDPSADLAAMRARDAARAGGYAWLDRAGGIVRVPIDVAMARVVARGAAGFDPVDGPAVEPTRERPESPAGGRP